jgi:hypothetical protein
VFWAGVVLAGCAILSGRAGSQNSPSTAPTTPTGSFDTLTVRQIWIQDAKGRKRGYLGSPKPGMALFSVGVTRPTRNAVEISSSDEGSWAAVMGPEKTTIYSDKGSFMQDTPRLRSDTKGSNGSDSRDSSSGSGTTTP